MSSIRVIFPSNNDDQNILLQILLSLFQEAQFLILILSYFSNKAEEEVMGLYCVSTNLAKDLMKVDSETDEALARRRPGRGHGRHHKNCTACQVYRNDG